MDWVKIQKVVRYIYYNRPSSLQELLSELTNTRIMMWISCECYEDYEGYHAVVLPSLGPGATGKPIHLLPTLTKTIIRNFSWNIVSNIISEILPSFMNCKVVYNRNFFHSTVMNCERIDSDFWRHTQLHPMWLVCDYVLKIMHRYCINGGQVALL